MSEDLGRDVVRQEGGGGMNDAIELAKEVINGPRNMTARPLNPDESYKLARALLDERDECYWLRMALVLRGVKSEHIDEMLAKMKDAPVQP